MHALFHIRSKAIWPISVSRYDNSFDMQKVYKAIKTKLCAGMYLSHISTLNLTSYTDTEFMDVSDRYRLRDDNSPDMEKGMH